MSSGRWYQMAGVERNKSRKYAKQKKELEPIAKDIGNVFESTISTINRSVEKADEELRTGFRRDSAIDQNSELVGEGDEFEALSDAKMSSCCSAIKAEITALERKAQEAERLADEYQRNGDLELEEERRARERSIKEALS